jgi:hypothetical protein
MVPGKNGLGQIVKATIAIAAEITLATDFRRVVAVLHDLLTFTVRTTNAIGPA